MNYLVHFFNIIKYKNNVITHQFIKTYNILRKPKYESIWKSTKKIKTDEKCKPNFCCPPIINIPNGSRPTGASGAQGETGGVLNFADFFALIPPDNATTVAGGTQPVSTHLVITQLQ